MKSLRAFFIVTLLGFTLLIFAGLLGYNFLQFNGIIGNEVKNELKTLAEKEAGGFNSKLGQLGRENLLLAKNLEAMTSYNTDLTLSIIKKYIQLDPMILGSGFWMEPNKYISGQKYYGPYVYKDGSALETTWDYSNAEYDYFQYDWYKNGLKAVDTVAWSEPYYDEVSGMYMISLSSAIVKNGVPVGVTTIDINIDTLTQEIAKVRVGKSGYAFLVTKEGYYLAHKDKNKNLKIRLSEEKDTTLQGLGQKIARGTGAGIEEGELGGVNNYLAYAPLGETGLKMVIIMPTSETSTGFDITTFFAKNLIMFAGAMLLFGFIVYGMVTKKISNPLSQLSAEAERIAAGDLSHKVFDPAKHKDEIGNLYRAFGSMMEQLRQVISIVNKSAENIASTSDLLAATSGEAKKSIIQVASAIQEVAKGAQEQTSLVSDVMKDVGGLDSSLGQVAAGTQEQLKNIDLTSEFVSNMASSISGVSLNAKAVADSAERTKVTAEKGGQAVKMTTEGMDSIKAKTDEAANKITALGENSKHIGEIIQVIDEIAEQTNLLALNAAIEAARAGDHGKGFAVVADEVRKLAERSSGATKEIADLIQDIQLLTKASVAAMEEGRNEVERGVNLASDARHALKEILETVTDTYQQTQSILVSAEEMSKSSQQVVSAINNIGAISQGTSESVAHVSKTSHQLASVMENVVAVTEESSAAAQEVSASTEEMSSSAAELSSVSGELAKMAEELKLAVSRFKLN